MGHIIGRWRHWVGVGLAIALIIVASSSPGYSQAPVDPIVAMEQGLEQEFESYFGQDLATVDQSPAEIAAKLQELGAATGTTPAVEWAIPRGDHLHLVLIQPDQAPVVRDLYEVPDSRLRAVVQDFQIEVSRPRRHRHVAAQQLHEWLITPLEAEFMQPAGINTLLLCLGDGLRGLPIAALYDGDRYLIEKYNLTRIPAFNLIQTDYAPLNQGNILVMGSSEFQNDPPLPGVSVELEYIRRELKESRPPAQTWQGLAFEDDTATLTNFQASLTQQHFDVVHLATHARFMPGDPTNSYIQFWDLPLSVDRARSLPWNLPPTELLVLSACQTAVGDDQAELGFAGMALNAGVKSALGSLWLVDDVGTMALMLAFYEHLGEVPTKAEALRAAQLALQQGKVRIEDDRLVLTTQVVPLPPAVLERLSATDRETLDLSHPFYWSGFSLISSPW